MGAWWYVDVRGGMWGPNEFWLASKQVRALIVVSPWPFLQDFDHAQALAGAYEAIGVTHVKGSATFSGKRYRLTTKAESLAEFGQANYGGLVVYPDNDDDAGHLVICDLSTEFGTLAGPPEFLVAATGGDVTHALAAFDHDVAVYRGSGQFRSSPDGRDSSHGSRS